LFPPPGKKNLCFFDQLPVIYITKHKILAFECQAAMPVRVGDAGEHVKKGNQGYAN